MDENQIKFSDFLLAYAKTRQTISPETIQAEAQTLYTRLLDNPGSLKVCYKHFISMGRPPNDDLGKKRKRDDEPFQPRKKQKSNSSDVVDLTVEPKHHVTRSKAQARKNGGGAIYITNKRSSNIVGILPKGPTQWYGCVQYRKAKNGPLKEKRTHGCATENEVVLKINSYLKRIKQKGYFVTRPDFGKKLSSDVIQVRSIQELKLRKQKRKQIKSTPGRTDGNDVIVIETEYPKTSKYAGVTWDSKVDRWLASIQTHTKSKRYIRGGYFTNEISAGKCVNELCAKNGMSPLNPSLCLKNSSTRVVFDKQSKYVGIVYRPADDQWHCDLKYRTADSNEVLHINDGHGLWDSDEEELLKRVNAEVLRLKRQKMITVDFEYGTTKMTRAPESKYVGLEFDIDHGRWACWMQYKQPHSDILSTKFMGYETDQHKLAEAASNWIKKKKEDKRIKWIFLQEYGSNKMDLQRRNRARRESDLNRGDKDLFEVERIIEWKLTEEGRKYHVQWASAEDEYTWEPEEHVLHLELFQEFHRRNIERIQQQRALELQRMGIKPTYQYPSENYEGVVFDTRDCKWHASVTFSGKTSRGGAFDSEMDAALAVNTLCKQAKKNDLNEGIEKTIRHQLYSTSSKDTPENIFWIRTDGHVYFPTNGGRRSLRPECDGAMPTLERI